MDGNLDRNQVVQEVSRAQGAGRNATMTVDARSNAKLVCRRMRIRKTLRQQARSVCLHFISRRVRCSSAENVRCRLCKPTRRSDQGLHVVSTDQVAAVAAAQQGLATHWCSTPSHGAAIRWYSSARSARLTSRVVSRA